MDFKLDNTNLGLNEKNKKLLQDMMSQDKKTTANQEEESLNIDTFKMYNEFLTEKQAIIEIINEICEYSIVCCGKGAHDETKIKNIKKISDTINFKNRVIMILENYQEQPGLLDPILPTIVTKIMNDSLFVIEYLLVSEAAEKREQMLTCLKCLYQIIYVLCKIRGIQTIIKFFCSEVYVFEPVITYLLSLSPEDTENCDIMYVLILWTSILGLIPFDVETIDTKGIIISQLPLYFKSTLNSSGNIRDITAYALSKFMTRPDIIKKGLLKEMLEFFVEFLQNEKKNSNIFMDIGILTALYQIFKNGIPTDLVQYVDYIVKNVINFKFPDYMLTGGIVRRYFAKLTQRVGMVILKPKFQKWRYALHLKNLMQQKTQSPSQNKNSITINNPNPNENNEANSNVEEEGFDYEIDYEILEILIDKILTSLVDREYIVRWSSAKGLGRLCERLTKGMVDDILNTVFDLFGEAEENEFSWQGAVLAIAELCKRGLVLPEKLERVMFYLEKALLFEINKGTFCLGSNVRDSACYLAWALARAYSKQVMQNYLRRLAQKLILVMLFDKEVNCRRAASAAFQEHVGRQGYFPNGIEIITEADYFTLGNRTNCFLNIATFVAQFPDYTRAILDYLCENRIKHVDESIRILSAEALGLLAPFDPKYFIDKLIPELITECFSNSLFTRQGAILGIGYVLVGLKGKWDFEMKSKRIRLKVLEGMNAVETKVLEDSDYRKAFEENFKKIKFIDNISLVNENSSLLDKILAVPCELESKKLYKGKGGETMRMGVNNFIRLVCEAEVNMSDKIILEFFEFLVDNLKHPNLEIQNDACSALKLLMRKVYFYTMDDKTRGSEALVKEVHLRIKDIIKNAVSEENIYIKRGYTMSFSYFSVDFLLENLNEILANLLYNCKYKGVKKGEISEEKKESKESNNKNITNNNPVNVKNANAEQNTNLNDYELRRISIEALSDIMIEISGICFAHFYENIDKIMEHIFEGLKDYEIDKKLGDVGSKVREAAMKSLTSLMNCFTNKIYEREEFSDLFEKYAVVYLCGLLKQSAEKLNKIRHVAGEALQNFFYNLSLKENEYLNKNPKENNYDYKYSFAEYLINSIPDCNLLRQIFLEDIKFNEVNQLCNLDWLEPSYSFKKIIGLLKTQSYSFSVFEGIIISIGGLTEDVQRYSLTAIDNFLEQNQAKIDELIQKLYEHIINIFKNNEKDDRVIEPLFNTLAHLLTKSYFIDSKYLEFCDFIHKAIGKENYESKNIHKILASVDIYYNLLFFEKEEKVNLFKRALKSLLILMTHKYPVVRKKAAEKIFLYLSVEDPANLGITEEESETISLLLCDTNWTEGLSVIREPRNTIAEMFKINLNNLIKTKK